MIYLIQSAGYKVGENNSISYFQLLKIGYTEDSREDIRFMEYKLHNPTCQILYTIPEATEEHEKKLHYKFKDLLYEDYGREWFRYSDEVISYIKSVTLEELDKLPNSPKQNDKRITIGKREAKSIISYLFDTKEEIDIYPKKLLETLGDTISSETTLEYVKKDSNINRDKLNRYLKILESRKTGIYCENSELNQEVSRFMRIYDSYKTRYDRLKFICECSSEDVVRVILDQLADNDDVKIYYITIGPSRLKNLGYDITRIRQEIDIINFSPELLEERVYSSFKENDTYKLSDIKDKLAHIYVEVSYKSTPKAIDIKRWFEVREVKIYERYPGIKGRKQIRAYELLRSKRDILDEKYSE